MGTLNERSEKNLIGVHPDLVRIVRAAVARSPQNVVITEGLRTLARQRELFKAGKSQTLVSRHLTGHAVDVAIIVNGVADWDLKGFRRFADHMDVAAGELGMPKVQWGGSWKTFTDGPHFQLNPLVYPAK